MYISDRVTSLEAEGAYIVMAKAQALEKEGRDIIHMEIGQPDFPTFPYICESGMRAIKEGHTRYNPSSGLPRLREVIAEDAGKRRKMSIRAKSSPHPRKSKSWFLTSMKTSAASALV